MTSEYKPYKDREQLYRLYWQNDWSQQEIALKFGVSRGTIQRAMDDAGLPTRQTKSNKPGVRYGHGKDGHPRWGHYDGDKKRTVHIHQLLAIAKGAEPAKVFSNGKWQVHHDNGVPWDNRPDNIELLTASEHRSRHSGESKKVAREYSDRQLLRWIEAFVEEFGVVPAQNDIVGWPGPHYLTYKNRFGSWTEAVRQAGYTPRSEK